MRKRSGIVWALVAIGLSVSAAGAAGIGPSAAPQGNLPPVAELRLWLQDLGLQDMGLQGRVQGGGSQARLLAAACCKHCSKGKACGNTCISRDKTCHVGPGCACN